MIERLVITLAVIGVAFGAYMIGTRWQTRSISRREEDSGDPILRQLEPGIPAVVYFWAETCAPCKTVQEPELEKLKTALGPGGVQVIKVHALEQRDVADGWGVLGLPTTFIVDSSGEPRRVNHGIARAKQLEQQIQMVE